MPTNIITERIIGAELEPGLSHAQSLRRVANSISFIGVTIPEEPEYVKEWFELNPFPIMEG